MATTKGKDSSTSSSAGKEKRVASPSSNSRTSTATTPKSTTRAINTSTSRPSSSTVPAAHKAAASSTTAAMSTEKQVPSYLRPTISSRPESRSFKYVKKGSTSTGHEDNTQQKAAQTRRKSLDKPLSYNSRQPSTTTAPLLSPGHRERTITARSTSFAHRSSTISLEPVVGRTSKLKNKTAGKPVQASYVKKSTNSVTKMENSTTSPASGKLVPENIVHVVESKENDGDNYLIHEVDQDIAKVEGGDDADGPNSDQVVPKYENDNHTTDDHVVESEVMNSIIGEDEKLKSCDIPLVSEEKGVVPDAQTESESGNKLPEEKAENLPEGEDNNKINGNNTESHPEEQSVETEDQEVLLEVVKEEKGDHHDVTDKNSGDENKNNGNTADENKGKEGGIEGFNSKELGQDVESDGLEETKPVVENSTRESASKPQGGQGNKKESSPAYNEVIEETASKLMEKRKNKVKALVGAFETVIDKEAAASSTK